MNTILTIIKREIRLISSQKALVLIFFIAPIVYGFMYGSIYINKQEEKVRIAVVDMDGSELSRLLSLELNKTPIAEVVTAIDLTDAEEQLKQGTIQGYLFMEKGLQQNLLSLEKTTITLVVNASRFLPSSDLTAVLSKLSLTIGAGIRMKYFNKQGESSLSALQMANPITMDYRPLFNEQSSYGAFLLPGLLAIILQQTLLIGLVASMGMEQAGRYNRLFESASNSSILVGKTMTYLVSFLIIGLFYIAINFSVLGIPMRGSLWNLLAISSLFIATLVPMGLLIGSFISSPLLGMQIMAFSSYPIFLITGYSMPFDALPQPVQWLSTCLPTTPFLKIYLSVVQAGGSLNDNLPTLLHLIILLVLYSFLFLWRLQVIRKDHD